MKPTLKEKLRYYFENTMSSGPLSVIRWLGISSLLAILVLGLIIVIFGIKAEPEASDPLGFIEGAWKSLMATLDPGTMGGDEGWPFRMVRFMATIVGIFLISILIGIISSGIDEQIESLKKGKSKVLESNHVLILGWSEKIYTIIEQLIEANANQKNQAIVVLAERDKVEMEDDLKGKISDFKTSKLIVRSGNPLIPHEIEIVNADEAKSIIVLSPDKDNADIFVIKTVMAFTNSQKRKAGAYNLVAEIKNEDNLEAAELAGNGEAIYVYTADLIARITAQTCRQSGLSVIYSDLLQFEGDELYFQEEEKLFGKTFHEALLAYNDSSVIGIQTHTGQILINPNMEYTLQSGDRVIAISEDDDTIVMNAPSNKEINESLFTSSSVIASKPERTLMLGWNKNGSKIIQELDEYVPEGSEVTILHNDMGDAEILAPKRQKVHVKSGKITDRKTLEDIHPEAFDHIILLSDQEAETQESDAQTLISLLHLRNIGNQHDIDMKIVSEMRDLRNREIGLVTKADDFIIGDSIISLMMAQMAENRDLNAVFKILFESEGSEIYLKPITHYVQTTEPMNFYSLVERASRSGETAIGYRVMAEKDNSSANFGINVNPNKSALISLKPDDFLILLSED
ncbi:MAG: CASTOR/POLLUX-related putative ion channel [Flavobacteriales bacterium]